MRSLKLIAERICKPYTATSMIKDNKKKSIKIIKKLQYTITFTLEFHEFGWIRQHNPLYYVSQGISPKMHLLTLIIHTVLGP